MKIRNAAVLWLASALLDFAGARALDALGLIEGILSPNGARLALLVPLALLFFSARLCARLLAPGLLLGALLVYGAASRPATARRASCTRASRYAGRANLPR